MFNNKSGVHLFPVEYLAVGSLRLDVTDDHMQTALDAFMILSHGNLDDVLALPPDYVLRSSRTIAMMKLSTEKRAALWTVVKAGRRTIDVPYEVLERYRPLFKYLDGKEMAQLNLSDPRILTYIGTHAEVDRHKVGVVASKFMELNEVWTSPKIMSRMNNLLCGVPLRILRNVSSETFLQLSEQIFNHISACAPIQRRFFLNMMTRNDVLGLAYSWTAQDVSRLGVLLTELEPINLTSINPLAMRGITAPVMLQFSAAKLRHLTRAQVVNLPLKTLNIMAKKIKMHQIATSVGNNVYQSVKIYLLCWILFAITIVYFISN